MIQYFILIGIQLFSSIFLIPRVSPNFIDKLKIPPILPGFKIVYQLCMKNISTFNYSKLFFQVNILVKSKKQKQNYSSHWIINDKYE